MSVKVEDVVARIYSAQMLESHYRLIDDNTFRSEMDGVEYQIRGYTNGDLCSILVRFNDDKSHCYIELYYEGDLDGLLDTALSEDVLEDLQKQWMRKNSPTSFKYFYPLG